MISLRQQFSHISLEDTEAIIFDFGGVLFEIDYEAPVRAFAELGMKDFREIYAQAGQHPIFDQLETGQTDGDTFYRWLSTQLPAARRDQLEAAWNCILLGLNIENTVFAASLGERFPLYIFSNTNALHVTEFERMIDQVYGLDKFRSHFRSIVYSNELGLRKPHPEAFLEVCRRHGLPPAKTLFLDDSIQHVEGARRAGLRALHVQENLALN